MKKLAKFVIQAVVTALVVFAFMLLVAKHNEIHQVLFSEESKNIATAVAVCFTCVITGFAICFFQFRSQLAEEREKYLVLSEKYTKRTAQLKAVTKELHLYQQASQEQQIQRENDCRKNFFADIQNFPVDALDEDLMDLLGNDDGDDAPADPPAEED